MRITLDDEIRAARDVVEMYRNSWFMPRRHLSWLKCQRPLKWCGNSEQWREWLAAHAILRRLKRIRASRRVSDATRAQIRAEVKRNRRRRA